MSFLINPYRFGLPVEPELFAADFSGGNFLSSSSANFHFGDEDVSFSFWFKLDATVTDQHFLLRYDGGILDERSYLLFFDTGLGVLRFFASSDGTSDVGKFNNIDSLVSVVAGTWHHCVCGYRTIDNKLFISVDGETMVTGTHADGFYAGSTAEFRVGNTTLEGLIDSFSVYTKALTQSETGDLYNSDNGVPYPDMDQVNLQNHYKLNEEIGARLDYHGSDDLTDNSSVGRDIGKILD